MIRMALCAVLAAVVGVVTVAGHGKLPADVPPPTDPALYSLPPHPHRTTQLEYRLGKAELAFWTTASTRDVSPVLIPLPRATTTVAQLLETLSRVLLGRADGDATCELFPALVDGDIVASAPDVTPDTLVTQLLETLPLWQVQCPGLRGGDGGEALTLHPFQTPPLPPKDYRTVPFTGIDDKAPSTVRPYPYNGIDLMGDTITGVIDYIVGYVLNHWGEMHPFPSYPSGVTGRYWLDTGAPVPPQWSPTMQCAPGDDREACQWVAPPPAPEGTDGTTRIAITADWGSGTYESDIVAKLMNTATYDAHYTLHVGDVYYTGLSAEVESNCLGVAPPNVTQGVTWPHGSLGSFALNGNHEMYSRGFGYFDHFLPTLGVRNSSGQLSGQTASYFMLENTYWRVIALDTGYLSYNAFYPLDAPNNPQPQAIVDWLNHTVRIGDPTDKRGIVFVSHHQYFSAFSDQTTPSLATPQQLVDLLPNDGRTILWLWGHEHRLSFYDLMNAGSLPLNVYGRCIGVGGFPIQLAPLPPLGRQFNMTAYDDRVYQIEHGLWTTSIGFNGFSHMNFTGPTLTIDYRSTVLQSDGTLSTTASDVLVTEAWTSDATSGSVVMKSFTVVNPNITVVKY